jgi:hypothetical protein
MALFKDTFTLVSAVVLSTAACVHGETWTIADNFDNEDLGNVLWNTYRRGTAVSQERTGGRLLLRVNTPVSDYDQAGLGSRFRVNGDFEMRVDYRLEQWPAANGATVIAGVVNQGFGDAVLLSRQAIPYAGTVDRHVIGGYITSRAGDPTDWTQGTFRLVRVGNQFNGSVAPIGTTQWQPIGAPILTPDQNMAVFLSAATYLDWFAGSEVLVSLDDFRMNFTPQKPGDADFDGGVYFSDLLLLAQHYGKRESATWPEGDFNQDGDVDFDDLLIIARNFYIRPALGEMEIGPSQFHTDWRRAISMVPEPASLILTGLTFGIRRRPTGV